MARARYGMAAAWILATVLALSADADAEEYVLWGDARKGREVFAQKGCGTCHAIRGTGPGVGPDLGRISARHLTMTRMAGAMWSHAPSMEHMAAERRIAWKEFRGSEMRDLIAFLYAVSALDEPGDPRRGARLFVEKGCATCHGVKGQGPVIGPRLEQWTRYGSPILWAELMWSHALGMETKVREFGLRWPRFEGNEMVDLIAYIQRELATRPRPAR